MKAGGRGHTDTRERFGIRRALVVAQVALSLVLVVGALLFVRSFRNLVTLDAGFRQDGVLVAHLDMRRAGFPEARLVQMFDDITHKIRGLPGVDDAAQASIVPVSGSGWNQNIVIDGRKRKEIVNFDSVGDHYFKTMGTPLLSGRDFDERDANGGAKVAIVTESFARVFFGGENPIGRTFQIDERPGLPNPEYQIIGLAKDSKYGDLRDAFGPIGYFPALQDEHPGPSLTVIVRSRAPLTQITGSIGAIMRDVHPSIIVEYQTLASQVKNSLLRDRLMATLSGFFGGLAALIAMIGLYGVMSYSVMRRRNEIGIRMALGADRREVLAMVMREALTLLAAGLVIGLVSAIAAGRSASALLFGLQPHDPSTLALAAATLAIVAIAASYVPALRASRLEPTTALREE
jgi:predicted permease